MITWSDVSLTKMQNFVIWRKISTVSLPCLLSHTFGRNAVSPAFPFSCGIFYHLTPDLRISRWVSRTRAQPKENRREWKIVLPCPPTFISPPRVSSTALCLTTCRGCSGEFCPVDTGLVLWGVVRNRIYKSSRNLQ